MALPPLSEHFPERRPHLAPVRGIQKKSLYANLALVPDAPKRPVQERKAAAVSEAQAEALLKRKIDQANRVLDALEAREKAFAAQIKELSYRRNATSAKIARIEDGVVRLMDEARLKIAAGNRRGFRLQQSPEALEIVDETKIPREYMREPKTPPSTPDKVAIKKALAESEDVAPSDWGCKLTSKTSLIRN